MKKDVRKKLYNIISKYLEQVYHFEGFLDYDFFEEKNNND